jgi:hypothetical protein
VSAAQFVKLLIDLVHEKNRDERAKEAAGEEGNEGDHGFKSASIVEHASMHLLHIMRRLRL